MNLLKEILKKLLDVGHIDEGTMKENDCNFIAEILKERDENKNNSLEVKQKKIEVETILKIIRESKDSYSKEELIKIQGIVSELK